MDISKKIKILFIGPIPPEHGGRKSGGVATYCWELSRHVERSGHTVSILTDVLDREVLDNQRLLTYSGTFFLSKLFIAIAMFVKLLTIGKIRYFADISFTANVYYKYYSAHKAIKSVQPDIIHVANIVDPVLFSVYLSCQDIPIIATDHGVGPAFEGNIENLYGFKTPKLKQRIIDAINLCTHVVCVSKFTQDSLFSTLALSKSKQEKFTVIHNPVDSSLWSIENLPENETHKTVNSKKYNVIFSGVFKPFEIKNIVLLLNSFNLDQRLKESCSLTIITTKEAGDYARKFMNQNSIDGVAYSPIPRNLLPNLYATADVLVVPSKKEGFGLVYTEALSCGVPVVGYYRTIKELSSLFNCYIGEEFNSDAESETDLADKILRVLETNINKEQLRNSITHHLSWENQYPKYNALYNNTFLKLYTSAFTND